MKKLLGKRILFLAPAFFGYEKKIAEKMEQLGATVDFYDERSVTKPFEKGMLKISPTFFKYKTQKYYNEIIAKNKQNKYDYVFVIKCEMLPIETIRNLKVLYPSALFCLYLYDSLRNIKGIFPKIKEFDRVLSFDLQDTQQQENIIFRPLFYLDSFKHEYDPNTEFKYDVSFIGTIHSDRYSIIKEVKEICGQLSLSYYFYCFLQSKQMYFFYKLTNKNMINASKTDFSFEKIHSEEIAEIINQTRTVLDIQHPKQTGLTMRTIEMLGMNKKLITTNADIKKYDFYNPNNILVIDRHNVFISKKFLSTPYQKLNETIYKKYSLEYWILDVLNCL